MLESITSPEHLRDLGPEDLTVLADDIRAFLVDAISARGGHLGPNLGVVELTIALHRKLRSPTDQIVWDTGHQAYVHKLLTGRQADFATLRTMDGLSGYPKRSESPHDLVENSHASTALGYALGLAEAGRAGHGSGHVVAVVGDGSLTGGVALEALNLIGHRKPNLLAILNDNGRSYAPTVGGLASHLAPLRLHPGYETIKRGVEETLERVPVVGPRMRTAAWRVKEGAKALMDQRTIFEDLGWQYAGPVDGHDLPALERAIGYALRAQGPVLLHVVTQKGRGYAPSERDETDHHHSIGAFDPATGALAHVAPQSFTDVFGRSLLEHARKDPAIVGISAAMLEPTGLGLLAAEYPSRVVDTGIAEQVAVTMAAGMAMRGMRPVVAVYSTFLQRAFDQLLLDICLHRLPVTFVLDRAGITGPDGASHHGVFDLSYLRLMPDMTIMAPRDGEELRDALAGALRHDGPVAIRIPKGATAPVDWSRTPRPWEMGTWDVRGPGSRSTGRDVLLLGAGAMAPVCEEARQLLEEDGVTVTLVDPRFVKPLDERLCDMAASHRLVITVEDNVRVGGFGSGVAEALGDAGVFVPVLRLGIPDRFLPHGKREALLASLGLDAVGVAEQARKAVQRLER